MTISSLNATTDSAEENWRTQLDTDTQTKLEELTTWLSIKQQPLQRAMASEAFSKSLSDVAQLSSKTLRGHPLAEKELNSLVKKYNLRAAYLFDNKHRLVGRSSRAATPNQLVKQKAGRSFRSDKLTEIDFFKDKKGYILTGFAKIQKDKRTQGYILYKQNADVSLADMESKGVSRGDISVHIARKADTLNPVVIRWPLPFKFSKFMLLNDTPATLPFFERSQSFGVYQSTVGEPVYAELAKPDGFSLWQIAVQLPTSATAEATRGSKIWIFVLAAIAYLILVTAEYILYTLYRPLSEDQFSQAEKVAAPVAQRIERLQMLAQKMQKKKEAEKAEAPTKEDKPIEEKSAEDADTAEGEKAPDVIPEAEETEEEKQSRLLAEELKKTNMVKSSLMNDRIRLFYQPIVDRRGKAAMYETLIRVLDEENNLMAPAEFFPLAIKYQFLDLIDDTVLVASIRKHIQLLNQGEKTVLCLNLSHGAFSSERFMNVFMDGLSSGQVHPDHLVFEVESQEVISDDASMSFIRELKRLGCKFSIDYLGGGERSIHAAKQLGFNNIKVSALKFQDMATNSQQLQEFTDIIRKAQDEGITVIVEKIETEFVWQLCKTLDVDYVQGFYIAKPDDKIHLGWKEKNYSDPKVLNQIMNS